MAAEVPGQVARYFMGACLALILDSLIVTLAIEASLAAWLARALGLSVGLATTYLFSLAYVFKPRQQASGTGFLRYILGQSPGTAANYLIATALLTWAAGDRWLGLAAVTVGAGCGFVLNFFSARRMLSARRDPPS